MREKGMKTDKKGWLPRSFAAALLAAGMIALAAGRGEAFLDYTNSTYGAVNTRLYQL